MKIIQDFIKEGSINRPKIKNSCTYITVHETANEKKGADAAAHASYVKSLNERTSWHYTVDDNVIIQHLPDEEKSYHTASSNANENSIAIELCVNSDGDFERTKENAVWLIRELMKKHNIPKENILSHRDWTGKTCPQKLLENGWDAFIKKCASEDAQVKRYISVAELRAMGYWGIEL